MAIDVLIKQKLFGSKTMPLEVILGEKLHYGNFVSDQLNVGELGDTEFIAYNPESIGRGFSVVWNPKEKKTIVLRLPQPSTTQELKDFYAAIERMVKHWDGKLIVDGNRVSLPDFLSAFDNMVDFNHKIIKQFSQQVLDGEHDTLTLYSTMWPLAIGKEEATLFMENIFSVVIFVKKSKGNGRFCIAETVEIRCVNAALFKAGCYDVAYVVVACFAD